MIPPKHVAGIGAAAVVVAGVLFLATTGGVLSAFGGQTLNTDWHTASTIEDYRQWRDETLPKAMDLWDEHRCGDSRVDDIQGAYATMVRVFNGGISNLEDAKAAGNTEEFTQERTDALDGLRQEREKVQYRANQMLDGSICIGPVRGSESDVPRDKMAATRTEGYQYPGGGQLRMVAERIKNDEIPDTDGDGVRDADDTCPRSEGSGSDWLSRAERDRDHQRDDSGEHDGHHAVHRDQPRRGHNRGVDRRAAGRQRRRVRVVGAVPATGVRPGGYVHGPPPVRAGRGRVGVRRADQSPVDRPAGQVGGGPGRGGAVVQPVAVPGGPG